MDYKQVSQSIKLDPKIRMVANGSEEVNTLRAERSPTIAIIDNQILDKTPTLREPDASPDERPKKIKWAKLDKPQKKVYVNVLIETKEEEKSKLADIVKQVPGLPPPTFSDNFISASVALSELGNLLEHKSVISIENAERVRFLPPLQVTTGVGEPEALLRDIDIPEPPEDSKGVLIGIIDVQGFDFARQDFLKNNKTRFIKIWDQSGETRDPPDGFGYGSELDKEHMDQAIEAADTIGLPATMLEPQSQMVPGSHGTHVASIAAGNLGVCPHADIAGVVISLPIEDTDRRKSFYDSSRIMHAVDYIFELGEKIDKPVSINISLGTNGHAHDASSVNSRWIDHKLSTAGRNICVAAGNAGQESPAEPGDWGFVMGRIHTSGRLKKTGDTVDIEWIVLGDGIADLSENELEIWYNPQDRIAIQIKPPGMSEWIGPIKPGFYRQNKMLSDGTFVSIYNELYIPANGDSRIACYLSPFFSEERVSGVRAGTWLVRLIGLDIRDGKYHGWVERDDPRRLGKLGFKEAWAFPSFFSENSTVDNSTVSSLACGQRVISVANLDQARRVINLTSSQGPTRDGRQKPEIAAPGTDIVAANGFSGDDDLWISMSGTSMASPYVAGVAAHLLTIEPKLTAAQIGGIICRTARPIPGYSFQWEDDAGFGEVMLAACLIEVQALLESEEVNP